jgi:hypothetical protein
VMNHSESPLPLDSSFQGNSNTGMLRYHSRRIVGSRACRWHPSAISVSDGRACQLTHALHLPPHWTIAVDAVGVPARLVSQQL